MKIIIETWALWLSRRQPMCSKSYVETAISGAIDEATKELKEKARALIDLHMAEQEALRPPKPEQWYKAVDELSKLL